MDMLFDPRPPSATAASPRAPLPSPHDLLVGLNPEQEAAVKHAGAPLLIVAGAGSGKTRVLSHRIAYLMATGTGPPRPDPGHHLHQQGRRGNAGAD